MSRLIIRKVAVLGAGVMGAQIAAHCANARVPVILFDLPGPPEDPNAIPRKAVDALRKLEPAPLATPETAALIELGNYGTDLAKLAECDLVIEAIAEKMEWKLDLYSKVAPALAPHAIFATNTSGLSIHDLSLGMPEAQRGRFTGLHFFNPPRYMALVELIPTPTTDPAMIDALETWLTTCLGKNIVRALDTPNFVANRVGVFSILAVMHHTARMGLGFDEVDALTGPLIGRPKSATFRTADVVGLDTLAHVIHTMQATLPGDPWHPYYRSPDWLQALIAQGALGQKTRGGIFRKDGKTITVLDLASQAYRPSTGGAAPEVLAILKDKDPARRFAQLRASEHPQAQFLWAIFRDVFHYCAVHLGDIADSARDVDFAMRWGFGWAQGPFETWQAAGWQAIAEAVRADIDAGRAMAAVPLPAWVFDGRSGVHQPTGSWSAREERLKPRSTLPVYARQVFSEQVLGEAPADPGQTLWECGGDRDGVRLWTLPGRDARIGILSFKSKMHAIGSVVLEGLVEAVARAERDLDGLVIWHDAPFAVGANLQEVVAACQAGQFELLDKTVVRFQGAAMAIKHAQVPIVAALQGMALGGGCEFALHAAHRVFALESYVGLVEAGVGLIPSGGGSKELALRAAAGVEATAGGDVFPFIQPVFETIAMAKVSKSAVQAVSMGFGRTMDDIVFHPRELLHVALARARALAESAYRPPVVQPGVKVAGRTGIANCEMMLTNMQEGGYISAHDYRVAKAAATALCGGEVAPHSLVPEQWLLDVERALFLELLQTPETQARIVHMLETGKPLRN